MGAQGQRIDLTQAPTLRLHVPFSRVGDLLPIGEEQLLVTDVLERELLLINLETQSRVAVGNQGGGPGEWRNLSRLLRGPAGSAILVDAGKRAIHQISTDGRLRSSIPWPVVPGEPVGGVPIGADAQGAMVVRGSGFGETGPLDSVQLSRWEPATGLLIPLASVPNPARSDQAVAASGGLVLRRGSGRPMESRELLVALPDGGVARILPAPFRVDQLDTRGMVKIGDELDFQRVPVSRADRQAWRDGQERQSTSVGSINGGGQAVRLPAPSIRDEDFPATLPPFLANARVISDPEGRVWIPRVMPAGSRVQDWDIVVPGAGRVGVAEAGIGSVLMAVTSSAIFLVRVDEATGLQYVEKHRRSRKR
ncbi:MAG: hypothetical protein R3B35_12395 [Gemmatimonadales bacterium]